MKIAIIGYSGSGKSTLARLIAQKQSLPLLHLDRVQHLPGWQVRPQAEKDEIIDAFLRENPSWVIDGNYSKNRYEERMAQADRIVMLLFSPLNCLWRVFRRYCTYKGCSRPDMAEGCEEKLDWEFVRWILWDGRSQTAQKRYESLMKAYPQKVTVLRSQRQLDRYIHSL